MHPIQCIELQYSEAVSLCLFKTVRHQGFADVLSSHSVFHCIACVADVSASADIVRVENIHSHYLTVKLGDSGVGLLCKEFGSAFFVKIFGLGECFSLFHYLVPYAYCCGNVLFGEFSYCCQLIRFLVFSVAVHYLNDVFHQIDGLFALYHLYGDIRLLGRAVDRYS